MPVTYNRIILIVIDACGVGELPDAAQYGDVGASTIPNVADAVGGLKMPNCQALGLGNIVEIRGVPAVTAPQACYGKMLEKAAGKDSTSGHWEIAGVTLTEPFPVFPQGFPTELIQAFEKAAGVMVIGNFVASGTEIIEKLGEEHLRSKAVIVYTSADSVFQIAAHEELYPIPELYRLCRVARQLCTGKYAVGRVIARPFVGSNGKFQRTANRKDFSRLPPGETVLDVLVRHGRETLAIGKIYDLFAGKGITDSIKTSNNQEVMAAVIGAVRDDTRSSLVFANCVDFDQNWGHRNDEKGFATGLEDFDSQLGELLPLLADDDLLILTADHGCDPTLKHSTDHTREFVPLLVYSKKSRKGQNLGVRATFADIAATVADIFVLPWKGPGESFRKLIVR